MIPAAELFSLQGKIALVTGATGYLGRSMSLALAEAGAKVIVNSRSEEKANLLVDEIAKKGLKAEKAIFDITNPLSVETYFNSYQNQPLNILVNNAYTGAGGTIEVSSSDDYAKSYEVAVIAAHNILRAALPLLRTSVTEQGDASVINIASMYGMVSPDKSIYASPRGVNPPFYGAAKAALIQWSRYAACEFGDEGIRINTISPGPFPSVSIQESNPSFVNKISKKVPMGRVGQAHELRGAILFLASSASSYVNGSNLVVDGGWTCW